MQEKLSRIKIVKVTRVVRVFVIAAAATSAAAAERRRLDIRDLGIAHGVVEID
jgi:hypothetical protein